MNFLTRDESFKFKLAGVKCVDHFPFLLKSIRSIKRNKSIVIKKKKRKGKGVIIRWTLSKGYRKRKSQAKALAYGTQGRQHSPEPTHLCRVSGEGEAIRGICTQRWWFNRKLAGMEEDGESSMTKNENHVHIYFL